MRSLPESFSRVTDPAILITVEQGGYLEERGRSVLCEIVDSGSVSVFRSLTNELGKEWRYREEVKVESKFTERPLRIPHVIQGDVIYILIQMKSLHDVERRLNLANEWHEALEMNRMQFELVILHPNLPHTDQKKWKNIWPCDHTNIAYSGGQSHGQSVE